MTAADTGRAINHPANLKAGYRFATDLLEEPIARLAARVEEDFQRLLGG